MHEGISVTRDKIEVAFTKSILANIVLKLLLDYQNAHVELCFKRPL